VDDQAVFIYKLVDDLASAVAPGLVPKFGVTVCVSTDNRFSFFSEDMFELLDVDKCRLAVLKIGSNQHNVLFIVSSVGDFHGHNVA